MGYLLFQQQENRRWGFEFEYNGMPQREITGRETGFKGSKSGSRIIGQKGNFLILLGLRSFKYEFPTLFCDTVLDYHGKGKKMTLQFCFVWLFV